MPTPPPSQAHRRDLTRREWLCGAAAIGSLALAMPHLAHRALPDPGDYAALIDNLSELVLPGSAVAQPGAFIASVLPNRWRGLTADHVRSVSRWLNRHVGGDFVRYPLAIRMAALNALDDIALAASPAPASALDASESWRMLKRALLTAWYTSEPGGAGDLAFELVPGRWQPDIPLSDAPHPLSNDWLAIWFS